MSAQSLVNQGYYGYKGWGDSQADADFAATHGAGKGGPSSSGSGGGGGGASSFNFTPPDPVEEAKKLQQFYIQQNQPAIQSFQQQIPEVQNQYKTLQSNVEATRGPLEERYNNLLASIKGNQTTATNRQTVATANELGRRGIQGGGLYDQTFTDALNPITAQYTGMYNDAKVSQDQALQGITNQESNLGLQGISATRDIQNQIAQLQTGNPAAAMSGAMTYGNEVTQGAIQSAQLQMQQEQAARDADIRQKTLDLQSATSQQDLQLKQQQLAESIREYNNPHYAPVQPPAQQLTPVSYDVFGNPTAYASYNPRSGQLSNVNYQVPNSTSSQAAPAQSSGSWWDTALSDFQKAGSWLLGGG